MKDPAFLFYPSDFLTGVSFMTNEQVGKYIKLLCLQHQFGRLTRDQMNTILDEKDTEIWSKFELDSDKKYYNKRLELEITKRSKHKEKQRENGLKGGRPKNPNETQDKPKRKPLENEIVIINENINSNNYSLLKDTLLKWFAYKNEKNQFYKETGLKSLLTQIKNNVDKFGEEAVNEVINNSMANNYTGIIFDNLKKSKPTYGKKEDTVPGWFDKEIEIKKPSEEKRKEIEKMLKGN